MKSLFPNSQLGASIIEILIVLVIAAILVTFAVTRFSGATTNLHRQNVAREFKVNLERARFDSVKRRPDAAAEMARISIIDETSYSVTTDLNQDGIIDTSETRIVDISGPSEVRIILPTGITAPVSIAFDRRGHSIIEDYYGTTTDHVIFCGAGCTASNANNSNSTAIYISPTGTVAMIGGAEDMPSIDDPNVSNVASTYGINPDVAVWLGPPPSPVPTPEGSPVPSPTTVPSPWPTPSPNPSPNPSPMATPVTTPSPTPVASPTPLPACVKNERPGTPPRCLCLAPWFVGKNGKCGP